MQQKVHQLFAEIVDARYPRSGCAACDLRDLWCLPKGLNGDEFLQVDRIINRRKRIKRNEYLYHAGNPFHAVYALRTGFFKTLISSASGMEHVSGFHMAGELLGMDAICDDRHSCNAIALEDSELCEIPFSELEMLGRKIPALQHHFHKIMSREIFRNQLLVVLLSGMNADERLAAFLVNLSQRYGARGYSATQFRLRMTRSDIGSYLGLKLETVSRTLSKFQESGLISVHNKQLVLNDLERLKQIAERAQQALRPDPQKFEAS
jgi:CRP/FNR family transcriptional regulator